MVVLYYNLSQLSTLLYQSPRAVRLVLAERRNNLFIMQYTYRLGAVSLTTIFYCQQNMVMSNPNYRAANAKPVILSFVLNASSVFQQYLCLIFGLRNPFTAHARACLLPAIDRPFAFAGDIKPPLSGSQLRMLQFHHQPEPQQHRITANRFWQTFITAVPGLHSLPGHEPFRVIITVTDDQDIV